jgi:hypothetical protein
VSKNKNYSEVENEGEGNTNLKAHLLLAIEVCEFYLAVYNGVCKIE